MGRKSKIEKVIIKKHSKRGRPKGSKNRATIIQEREKAEKLESKNIPPPLHPPRNFKLIGYCGCGNMIGECDIDGKKYRCPHCNKIGKVRELKKKKGLEEYTSKKDYLERVTESAVLEAPVLSDELDPKDVVLRQ